MEHQQQQQEDDAFNEYEYEYEYGLDMGPVSLAVRTRSRSRRGAAVQRAFDAALAQTFGYNHEEALRLFRLAMELDDDTDDNDTEGKGGGSAPGAPSKAVGFPMGHWGVANALIGNYNNGDGLDEQAALESIQVAQRLEPTGWEKALIDAMAVRCEELATGGEGEKENDDDDEDEGQNPAAKAALRPCAPRALRRYAEEMRRVYGDYGAESPDVATLFAESLLMLAPWKLWTPREPGPIHPTIPETTEAQDVLERGLRAFPEHAGLCHLYCHLMELSAEPEKALPAADVLRRLVPDQGHLLHMASHVDMWCAQYQEAIDANVAGIAADDKYVALDATRNESNFYKFYRMHNHQFLVWAAMFDGQYGLALRYARKMEAQLTREHVTFVLDGDFALGALMLEAFATTTWHVLVRFGKWLEILDEPIPGDTEAFAGVVATAHYARGVALAALGRVPEARAEQEKFSQALSNPALDGRCMQNNPMVNREGSSGAVLQVAEEVLAGEIEYRAGNLETAFEHLREAVRRDTGLIYDEPWGWMVPARHALGALLTEAGQFEEAHEVFLADLKQYKENLWSLRGLLQTAQKLEREPEEVAGIRSRLQIAEARADEKFAGACYCATRTRS